MEDVVNGKAALGKGCTRTYAPNHGDVSPILSTLTSQYPIFL